MPVSHAARLVAISRDAKAQSEDAIRGSLRLLRQPAYPDDRPSPWVAGVEPSAAGSSAR